jgi:ribosome-binding factor A
MPAPTRRTARAARVIREAVSTGILLEIKDPRVDNVTVIDVEVAEDMRSAKVYVSVMGTPAKQALAMKGLESARGFLQSKIGERLDTRYIPILNFSLTDMIQKNQELEAAFRKIDEEKGLAISAFDEVQEEGDEELLEEVSAEEDMSTDDLLADESGESKQDS